MILLPNLCIRKNMPIFFGIGTIIHKRWERQCVLYAVLYCSQLILFPYIYYCVILISNYILCRRSYLLGWFVYCSKTLCKFSGSPKFFLHSLLTLHGLQQPGRILFQELVIFCVILSHFCDLFWNITIITNICFIAQFFRPEYFFCTSFPPTQKKFCGPPGAPKSRQEPKTFLKLLLNLADSGWLWLWS